MAYSWWWPAFKYGQKVLRSRAIRGSNLGPRRFYHRRGWNYYRVSPMGEIQAKHHFIPYWTRRSVKPPMIYGPITYDTAQRFRNRSNYHLRWKNYQNQLRLKNNAQYKPYYRRSYYRNDYNRNRYYY